MTLFIAGMICGLLGVIGLISLRDIREQRKTGRYTDWGIPFANHLGDWVVLLFILFLVSFVWDFWE